MTDYPEKIPATILLVEDDPAILNGVADLLEVATYCYEITVHKAVNGRDALRLLETIDPPDLIMSDLAMPELDGYQLVEKVRQNPQWIHVPIILLTAKVSKKEVHKGWLAGVEQYITKPFDTHDLIQSVENLLNKTTLQKNARASEIDGYKRDILHALQHEFRTPLTYVSAYFELLTYTASSNGGENPEELQEFLVGIQTGSQRLTKLIVDLIAALDIRSGEMLEVVRSEAEVIADVGEVLQDSAEKYTPKLTKHKIELTTEIAPNLPPIFGHRASLQDLLARVLGNALKFTKISTTQRKIALSATANANTLTIRIKDTGIGFPSKVNQKVFNLFYQYDREKWEQQGSGVGLTIVKGLVELHNGTVTASSHQGEGTELTLTFPLYNADAPLPTLGNQNTQKQATILVVEDEYVLREGLRDLLMFGCDIYEYNILTAADGVEALAILDDKIPDLIISDVMMPRLDGFGLIKKVQANPDWINIPFLFLTARSEEKDRLDGMLLGADLYMTKPYNSGDLLDLVETRLNRHFAKLRASADDFETLKAQILDSLEESLLSSLTEVETHAKDMESHLAETETVDDLKKWLQGIQHGSSQLSHLVENFTTLVELRTGAADSAYDLRLKPMEHFQYMLQERFQTVGYSAENFDHLTPAQFKQIKYTYSLSPTVPIIHADDKALNRAFDRLIYTTLVFIKPCSDTCISIDIQPIEDDICVAVSTNSTNLSTAQAARITDFLADPVVTTLEFEQGGSDLTIVKEFIKLHKGRTTFTYDPDNDGFTIKVYLPILTSPELVPA